MMPQPETPPSPERFTLDALALLMPPEAAGLVHPNMLPFDGILTLVDLPSDKPPHGAHGHRVLLPRAVAEAALGSLLGMGIGMDQSLTTHNRRQKVGVITEAWLDGRDVRVRGGLYAADFPEEVARIRALSQQGLLGMSFELTQAEIDDPAARIWTLRRAVFTGAAILTKASAAYTQTHVLAATGSPTPKEVLHMLTDLETTLTQCKTVLEGVIAANAEVPDPLQHALQALAALGPDKASSELSRLAGLSADERTAALAALSAAHQKPSPAPVTPPSLSAEDVTTAIAAQMGQVTEAVTAQLKPALDKVTELAAAVGLLTDKVTGLEGKLLTATPVSPGTAPLATDTPMRVPQRKTMTAQGAYPAYLSKYQFTEDKTYSEDEIDAILQAASVTDPTQRLAAKIELEHRGQLVR